MAQANISAQLVKQLREMTDAPMMDCKKALVHTDGNIEQAIDYLREKGLSKASKKADRVASEGVIALQISDNFKKASLLEINSETDFVAKNEAFQELVQKSTALVFEKEIYAIEELVNLQVDGVSFEEYLQQNIAKIGENIVLRKVCTIKADLNVVINGYVHTNKRVGVLVAIRYNNSSSQEVAIDLAKKLAMHAAAMKPQTVCYKEFSDEFIQKEKVALKAELEKENEEFKRLGKPLHIIPEYVSQKEITAEILKKEEEEIKKRLREQNKPETIRDKIITGQLERFKADNTLLDQRLTLLGQYYILDDKKRVEQILNEEGQKHGDSFKIADYIRFELGEGIEKQATDFAAEVAAQLG